MKNIMIIIGREYRERVYKKSFILTTLLMPLLMLLMMAAPSLLMFFGGGDNEIVVVDRSGIVGPQLASDDNLTFTLTDKELDKALVESLDSDLFGVLYIGPDIIADTRDIQLYANSSSSLMVEEKIERQVADIVERERLKAYDIGNLDEILKEVHADIRLTTYRNGEEDHSASSAAASSIVGMILGGMLYFFLAIYGGIVLNSIIEEKSSRILEVMVSTVRPVQMMMGKILGVALVAATQVAIWGVILIVAATVVLPAMLPDDLSGMVTAVQGGGDVLTEIEARGIDIEPGMVTAMASVLDTGYIAMIVTTLLLYLVGGFLLYASMYAAAGASVDQAQDAQQLTLPITIPIIIAFMVVVMIMNNPDSPVVLWCSMIPYTSPIVMMARIPSHIPAWQIVTSLVLLYATFGVTVWLASKIYRVGIFMHGSKPTFKDWWRWIRY